MRNKKKLNCSQMRLEQQAAMSRGSLSFSVAILKLQEASSLVCVLSFILRLPLTHVIFITCVASTLGKVPNKQTASCTKASFHIPKATFQTSIKHHEYDKSRTIVPIYIPIHYLLLLMSNSGVTYCFQFSHIWQNDRWSIERLTCIVGEGGLS